ncbi:MAG: glycosyltransferase [Ignavibacteria bacterium]|jgi:glycosyltransferase involved in cell wall biosynthesis
MKIVIIGTAYPMRGGIAQYNSILFKYLSEKNEVKIYSFKRQYPEFLFPGKTQYETGEPAFKIPEDKNVISVDSINPFNWFFTALKIRKENPDLLIYKYWIPFFAPCFFTISFIVKMFRKTKVLFICDNVIPHEKRIGDKFLTGLVFSIVNYFIVQSRTVEKDLVKFNKTNKPYKLSPHPLYNIFGEKVDKMESRRFIEENYKIKFNTDKVILFFGYIRKYKGLMYLLEAMPEILKDTNAKLLIAGEFYDDEKPYKEKIKELKLEENILLLSDFMPDEKIRYFFSACDCLVLPYTDATQSGIVQIAYYYDKPVIVTDVGGLSEVVISEKTGIIINPGNVNEVVTAVKRYYTENLENEFSENIKTEKLKYSWEVFTDNILELAKSSK